MDESNSREGRRAHRPCGQRPRIPPSREPRTPSNRIPPTPRALGAVLAGGGSRRFGSPKALAPFLGTSLVLQAVAALEGVCESVTVVTHLPGVEALLPGRTLRDEFPGMGPLAGLHAALGEAERRGYAGVFLLACDMPLVTPELILRILERGAGAREDSGVPGAPVVPDVAVVPEGPGGMEPLCGWYPVGVLKMAARRLGGGAQAPESPRALSMHSFLDEVSSLRIPLRDLGLPSNPDLLDTDPFRSANTPEALAALEEIATTCPSLVPHLTRHQP